MAPSKRFPSLSGRIFRSMLVFALVGIALFSLVITGLFYVSLERDASMKLLDEAHRAAVYLDAEPARDRPAVLAEQFDGTVRFTLIAEDGTVLFDSVAGDEAPDLENHGDRPEVREALETGEGATSRYSTTLEDDTLYAAAPLSDGSVVRLAETRESLISFFLADLMVPVAAALLVAVVLVLVLSRLLARHLMRPLDNLDVSAPLDNAAYAEMQPLLERIDEQQRTLRAQNKELARAETMRRDFSANVSHEMKTPLQVISGYAELMENGLVPPEDVPRFASLIHQESQTMRALINDVLILSRLDEVPPDEAGAAPIEVLGIAERAASRLEKLAEERAVTVEVRGEAATMEGNESLMEQMIYNLVENAIRYNEEGGHVVVEVGVEGEEVPEDEGPAGATAATGAAVPGATVVVRVSDDGPGIPEAKREKVFERFYRLEKSRSKETGGTGLGLAIVKHGVQRHHGTIEVGGTEGEGAQFTLRFPKGGA